MKEIKSIKTEISDLKDILKAFDDFKNKQKTMKQCFLICESMYILKVFSIHYTVR